jgi:hypothetical protein
MGLLPGHTWLGKTERWLFGDDETPGALGTGQFKPKPYEINQGASDIRGYDDWRSQLAGGAQAAGQRGGPQIATGAQDQFRGQQMGLAQQLMGQAQGKGPSIAQAQLQQATDRNMAQAMALGASQNAGTRGAGALRGIANQQAQIGQQMAADSGLLRLQEQQQAQGLLNQVLAGGRGQDLGLATSQAGMDLQSRGMNDQLTQFYVQQGLSLDQAQMQARMQMEGMKSSQNLGMEGLRSDAYHKRADANRDMVNKAVGAVSSYATGGAGGAAP